MRYRRHLPPPPQKFGFQLITKTMSIKSLIGTALVCSAFLFSCHKTPEGMQLVAEGFDGSKAAVQGERSYWVDGEMVSINGTDYRVNVVDVNAYASDVENAATYCALYPNTMAPEAATSSSTVTVNIPSVYVYRTADGRQALDLPMAAYGTSNERLVFKHLTAAITVQVVNDFGIDLSVDSIVVTSNEYQISGSRAITLGNDISIDTLTTATAADRRVVVRFNGESQLKVNSGTTAEVQVPVLPVGRRNKFTITVATHNADDAAMKYTFNRTQASAGNALLRAQLGYAPAKFGGVFSVSNSKKVRFAPGNLQYQRSTSKWRFAQKQSDIASYSASYYTTSTSNWIDLFGFATSGNARVPCLTSTNLDDYDPGVGVNDISKTDDDWGWHNSIENGGRQAGIWRTLTADEWGNIFSRTDSVGKARVGGQKGVVILPDGFVRPVGCSFSTSGTTIYNATDWSKMEIAGAIFLPECGYRYGTTLKGTGSEVYKQGWYWSSNRSGSTKNGISFLLNIDDAGTWHEKSTDMQFYMGMSVRLVRDVN